MERRGHHDAVQPDGRATRDVRACRQAARGRADVPPVRAYRGMLEVLIAVVLLVSIVLWWWARRRPLAALDKTPIPNPHGRQQMNPALRAMIIGVGGRE